MPDLKQVDLPRDLPIFQADEPASHVYFPHSGMISIGATDSEGSSVEIAAVGRDGMTGIALALGSDRMANSAMVQVPGTGSRLDSATFSALLDERPGFRRLMLRSVLAALTQISQNVACAQLHSIEARCARWLLTAHDYAAGSEFQLTQEYMAMMLGVTRPSVSSAASALHRAGLITYARGRVQILNRPGLEQASCECYRSVRQEFARLLM